MTDRREFKFIQEPVQVIVSVPPELKDVRVAERPLGYLADYPGDANFEPKRLLINFELIDGQTDEIVKEFKPAIELKVYFTQKDIDSVSEGKTLGIAFWKGKNWVRFEDKHKVSREDVDDPIWAGYFFAQIINWTDPPVALGE